MLWDQPDIVERFAQHYETPRGYVRTELVDRQIRENLAAKPGRVIDLGAGEGHVALRWAARGCAVTLVDPARPMLEAARRLAATMPAPARERVTFLEGTAADAASSFPPHTFDLVMSHGVLMYLDDPRPFLADMAALCRPGGLVSVMTKNAGALAMRPGLQRDFRTALASMDQRATMGWLGVRTRGDTVQELSAILSGHDVRADTWYGVGVFTDHQPDLNGLSDTELADLVELEWQASRRDPYRAVARLVHVTGQSAPLTSRPAAPSG